MSTVVVLQLLRPAEPWNRVFGRPGNDVALKQNVDALQRNALRLRNAQDSVNQHEQTAGAKEKEGAIGNVGEHDGGELGDDKVKQPLSHESGSHDEGSDYGGCQQRVESSGGNRHVIPWLGEHSDDKINGTGPQPNE